MNSGEMPLNISNLQIAGSQEFQLAQLNPPRAKPPSARAKRPVAVSKSASPPRPPARSMPLVSVTDNAPGSPQILELTGIGQGPVAVVSPPTIAFGNQPENTSSTSQTITVTNAGDETLTITASRRREPATRAIPAASEHLHAEHESSPSSGQSSCTITVVFSPQATGPFQAEIDITDNSAGGSTVQISHAHRHGHCGRAGGEYSPRLHGACVRQRRHAGRQRSARLSPSQTPAARPWIFPSIAITGANMSDFAIVAPLSGTPCPTSGGVLASGNSNSSLRRRRRVRAADSRRQSRQPHIYGQRRRQPSASVAHRHGHRRIRAAGFAAPASSFNSQSEGTPSAAQIVTLANNGGSPASVSGVSLSGSSRISPSRIRATSCPPGKAARSASPSAPQLPRRPAIARPRSTFPAARPRQFRSPGVATQAGILLPDQLQFRQPARRHVRHAPAAHGHQQQLRPICRRARRLAAANVTGDFAISSDACASAATAPGGTCAIQIAFSPQAGASCATPNRTANLSLTDNAPGSPQSVPLSGTAMDFCFNSPGGQADQRARSARCRPFRPTACRWLPPLDSRAPSGSPARRPPASASPAPPRRPRCRSAPARPASSR